MPAYGQTVVNPRALSANQTLIYVGNQVVAFAQTVTHTFDLGTQQLYGVGSAMIQEIQQLKINPSITLDSFELNAVGENLLEANDQGISLASFIVNNAFTIAVKEGTGGLGSDLFVYVGCQASNFSESIPTNQIVTKTITFSALDVRDGSQKSILNPDGNLVQNFAAAAKAFTSLNVGE